MATITRRLAAELRSVFRRLGGTARGSGPALCISTGPDGTHVSTSNCDVAAAYHVPGNLPEEQLWITSLLLSDCEGKQDEPVQLERGHDGSVVAAWSDRGIPQRVQYDQVLRTAKPDLPELPPELIENPPELLAALHDTMTTTDPDSIRYAIGCVQLPRPAMPCVLCRLGDRTSEAARKFEVSEGRVSQLRRELAESWRGFVGDETTAAA